MMIALTLLQRSYGAALPTTGDALKVLLEDWRERPKTKELLTTLHKRTLVRHDKHNCPLMQHASGNKLVVRSEWIKACEKTEPQFIQYRRWGKRTFLAVSPALEEYLDQVLFEPLRREFQLLRGVPNPDLATIAVGLVGVWGHVSDAVWRGSFQEHGQRQLRDDDSAYIGLTLFGGPRPVAELGWALGERPARAKELVEVLGKFGLVESKGNNVYPTEELRRLIIELVVPKANKVIALKLEVSDDDV